MSILPPFVSRDCHITGCDGYHSNQKRLGIILICHMIMAQNFYKGWKSEHSTVFMWSTVHFQGLALVYNSGKVDAFGNVRVGGLKPMAAASFLCFFCYVVLCNIITCVMHELFKSDCCVFHLLLQHLEVKASDLNQGQANKLFTELRSHHRVV